METRSSARQINPMRCNSGEDSAVTGGKCLGVNGKGPEKRGKKRGRVKEIGETMGRATKGLMTGLEGKGNAVRK